MNPPKKSIISIDEISHVANLAKLNLPDRLLLKFSDQLSSVIDYMSKIQKLNTEKVPETTQVTRLENIFREDEIKPSLSQKEALSNAKNTYNGFFKVKAVFEE